MKKVRRLCGSWEGELAADGFLNVCPLAVVIDCQVFHGFASLVSLGDDHSRDPGPDQDGATKGNLGVDHDGTRLVGFRLPGERKEPHRNPVQVALNPSKVDLEKLPDSQLPFLCDIDEIAQMVDEEADAIRGELMIGQGVLALQARAQELHRGPNFEEGNLVAPPNRGQDMRFHHVDERQQRPIRIGPPDGKDVLRPRIGVLRWEGGDSAPPPGGCKPEALANPVWLDVVSRHA
jgi:hypothetical protein